MQRAAKVTSKGQITIPKVIRRVLGIEEGDSVVFEADENGVHLRPGRSTSVFAKYAGIWRDGDGQTLEQINTRIHDMRGHDE